MGNFDGLSDVFELHASGEHASALSLVESRFEQFPDRRAMLTYWCACLKSLLGDPASALEDFEKGLAAGLWWAKPMLRADADLDAVKQLDAFAAADHRPLYTYGRGPRMSEPGLLEGPGSDRVATAGR